MHVLYYVSLALPLPHEHTCMRAQTTCKMHMCITPISGTRALILSRRGNQPYSEEINSTRGLLSNVGDNRKWDGGVVGGAAGGGRTTFDLANNSLIPGVTHVSIQKTPPPPAPTTTTTVCPCVTSESPVPGCVFSPPTCSPSSVCGWRCAPFFFLSHRRPELQLRPPGLLRQGVDSADTIYTTDTIMSYEKEDS